MPVRVFSQSIVVTPSPFANELQIYYAHVYIMFYEKQHYITEQLCILQEFPETQPPVLNIENIEDSEPSIIWRPALKIMSNAHGMSIQCPCMDIQMVFHIHDQCHRMSIQCPCMDIQLFIYIYIYIFLSISKICVHTQCLNSVWR